MEHDETKTFLGLEENGKAPFDIVILPIPYEMTTSYREGTEFGPAACIEASSQVELHDELLPNDLPCGFKIHTSKPWVNDSPSLKKALTSIKKFTSPWMNGDQFPIVLGGEHGLLLPLVESMKFHPKINGELENLTILQVDAHADLRDELNEERFSHGTVIRRSLEAGVGKVIQIGIRTYSSEEKEIMENDKRVKTWFARDLINTHSDLTNWRAMIDEIKNLNGPVWLTFDIDGLDGLLVPATGTPVPGGLSYWGAIEIIETLFSAVNVEVIGADVNEICTSEGTNLTEFSAALIATKILACHVAEKISIE
ncbi:MAG: agmatinase [Candidatus Poseidoniales archaeon]